MIILLRIAAREARAFTAMGATECARLTGLCAARHLAGMSDTIKLDESWRAPLAEQFAAPHMQGLKNFLRPKRRRGNASSPRATNIFARWT